MIRKMERESIYGKMDPNIKEILKMTIDMDMDKCVGRMGELIKENGSTGLKKIC